MRDLLLHICCAPDASVPIPELLNEGWNVRGYFYGSNIHPYDEYLKRLEALRILTAHYGIECEIEDYEPDEWLEGIRGLECEPECGKRCTRCFEIQLERCAEKAERFGYENFCTTLTISPHKNVTIINSIGDSVSGLHGLIWQNRIWRKNNGFLRSVRASKELGLYRQNYCGCVFSQRHLNGGSV